MTILRRQLEPWSSRSDRPGWRCFAAKLPGWQQSGCQARGAHTQTGGVPAFTSAPTLQWLRLIATLIHDQHKLKGEVHASHPTVLEFIDSYFNPERATDTNLHRTPAIFTSPASNFRALTTKAPRRHKHIHPHHDLLGTEVNR
jgi:hypothetical protein